MNIEELKLLWKEVFGDTDDYLESFFSGVYDETHTLVHCIDGTVVAALYMIPYDICMGNQRYKAMYLYALATKEEYRGKGIMSGLIKRAHDIGRERGYIMSFLIPAGESLYQYYKKMGYDIVYYQNRLLISRQDIINISRNEINPTGGYQIKNLSNQKFLELYEKSFTKQNSKIKYSNGLNLFYLETLQQDGGEILSICDENENREIYALLYPMKDSLGNNSKTIIYETNAENDDELLSLLLAISEKYEFRELEVTIPYNRKPGDRRPYRKELDAYIDRKEYAVIHPILDLNIDWNEVHLNRLLL